MLTPITRILFYIMLCLMLSSCAGCECCYSPDYECIEMQDAILIDTRHAFYNSTYISTFDSLVIRKENRVMRNCIGSQTQNVTFPINVNTQLFLRGTMLQSLDFSMPANSILTFYDGDVCQKIDSTTNFFGNYRWEFYADVQRSINRGVFIDSSSSEVACWLMKQMGEGDEWKRCTKAYSSEGGKGWVSSCAY